MSREIRLGVVVRLPDGANEEAKHGIKVFVAWEAFTTAIAGTDMTVTDYAVGPVKTQRRRRGRPRLTVAEPPTAA